MDDPPEAWHSEGHSRPTTRAEELKNLWNAQNRMLNPPTAVKWIPRGRLRTQFEYKPASLVAAARSLTAACSTHSGAVVIGRALTMSYSNAGEKRW